MICTVCSVSVARNRLGKWVHTDDIPKNFEPHDAIGGEVAATRDDFVSLRQAATDMLHHHTAGHPEGQCAFAQQLRVALEAS